MLAVNLKGPGAGEGFAAVHLDGRSNDEFLHRILVHVFTLILRDCRPRPIVGSTRTRGKPRSQIVHPAGQICLDAPDRKDKKAMSTGWFDPSYSHPV